MPAAQVKHAPRPAPDAPLPASPLPSPLPPSLAGAKVPGVHDVGAVEPVVQYAPSGHGVHSEAAPRSVAAE